MRDSRHSLPIRQIEIAWQSQERKSGVHRHSSGLTILHSLFKDVRGVYLPRIQNSVDGTFKEIHQNVSSSIHFQKFQLRP